MVDQLKRSRNFEGISTEHFRRQEIFQAGSEDVDFFALSRFPHHVMSCSFYSLASPCDNQIAVNEILCCVFQGISGKCFGSSHSCFCDPTTRFESSRIDFLGSVCFTKIVAFALLSKKVIIVCRDYRLETVDVISFVDVTYMLLCQ